LPFIPTLARHSSTGILARRRNTLGRNEPRSRLGVDVSRSAILSQSSRSKARKRREEEQKKRTHFAIHPLAGFIALIGLAASVATFWPHPKATVAPPVDPNDPFSSSVTVENAGLLPLLSVRFVLALRSGDFASGLSMAGPPNYSSSLCLLGS